MSTSDLFSSAGLLENNPFKYSICKEWSQACDALSNAVQAYFDVSLRLGAICMDTSPCNNFPSSFQDLDNELNKIPTYILKLRGAQAAIGTARNYSQELTPINHLPREILSNIFELVVARQYREFKPYEVEPPLWPDSLSQVCTSWRQFVNSTPALWSRINLVISGSLQTAFYARASQLLKRSAGAPLFIRVHETESNENYQELSTWLGPVVSRAYSLEFQGNFATDTLHTIMECWLENGIPGAVKELDFYEEYDEAQYFEPGPMDLSNHFWQFNLTPQRFRDFFQHVTLLRLSSVFPLWGLQTYGRLVHLSLERGTVTEAHLIALLHNNPSIRTLDFGLDITEATPRSVPPEPVQLFDLDVLNLDAMDVEELWLVLQLLAPGPRPLRMSIKRDECEQALINSLVGDEEIEQFFQRSNVTALRFIEHPPKGEITPWFPYMFSKLPYMRILTLYGQFFFSPYLSTPGNNNVCRQLQVLCLAYCQIDLNYFKEVLRTHPIRVLRLFECGIYQGSNVEEGWEMEDLERELSEFVSDVKCYEFLERDCSDPYIVWGSQCC